MTPNGQQWGAERLSRLMAHIEQFVFAAELADKELPHSKGGLTSLPELLSDDWRVSYEQ